MGGKFDDNSFTDGVSVDYNAGTRYWEMSVMNGKRGWGNCVKSCAARDAGPPPWEARRPM